MPFYEPSLWRRSRGGRSRFGGLGRRRTLALRRGCRFPATRSSPDAPSRRKPALSAIERFARTASAEAHARPARPGRARRRGPSERRCPRQNHRTLVERACPSAGGSPSRRRSAPVHEPCRGRTRARALRHRRAARPWPRRSPRGKAAASSGAGARRALPKPFRVVAEWTSCSASAASSSHPRSMNWSTTPEDSVVVQPVAIGVASRASDTESPRRARLRTSAVAATSRCLSSIDRLVRSFDRWAASGSSVTPDAVSPVLCAERHGGDQARRHVGGIAGRAHPSA